MRAKFRVESRTETTEGGTVEMRPVAGGSPENESFYKWTPGGSLTLTTVNKAVLEKMIPGQEFYLDFTYAGPTAA
jgi:hypothetical protein